MPVGLSEPDLKRIEEIVAVRRKVKRGTPLFAPQALSAKSATPAIARTIRDLRIPSDPCTRLFSVLAQRLRLVTGSLCLIAFQVMPCRRQCC